MDQKIRGITVTINGDTTGLGKALDTVKKQSIGLNRELKSVNKALNFNPSSASLLTEKQKVLTDSVRAAREELGQSCGKADLGGCGRSCRLFPGSNRAGLSDIFCILGVHHE